MKIKHLIYSLVFILGIATMGSCNKHTCPTYATSGQSKKRKKAKKPKKNAPWHKSKSMKKGKNSGRHAPK